MTVEVGGAGTLGVAFETTLGTYIAPTKWIPIRSESLVVAEDKVWRTSIRGVADRTGAIKGYTHVEGDIVFEVTPDALLYFMYASRITCVKTGAGPFTYTFTPAHVAKTTTTTGATTRKTLSILATRGGNPMGYLGCSVGQLAFSLDAGVLICTASIVGVDEGPQAPGTPSYTQQVVSGPGANTLEVPTSSARADVDTFAATINDNLVPANRLNGQRKAAYQNWGEREVSFSYEADFDALTDYNVFRNQTIQAITFKGFPVPATEQMTLVMNATAIETYEANLSSLGDVNRAVVNGHAFYNTSDAYSMVILSAEVIT